METLPDNVVYIDEFKRERWLHRLQVSRNMAKLGIVNADMANVIPIVPIEETDYDPA